LKAEEEEEEEGWEEEEEGWEEEEEGWEEWMVRRREYEMSSCISPKLISSKIIIF